MFINLLIGIFINIAVFLFFTRFIQTKNLKLLIVLNFFFINFISFFCFFEIGFLSEVVFFDLFTWINLGLIKINIGLLFDSVTLVMIFIVVFISSLVHIYSFSYMRHDPFFLRFMTYLSLFTTFMLVLVTSNNYLQLLIGWEGVGLSSYLLICFWYTRLAANLAAIKAMLINRIGDVCLLLSLCVFLQNFKNITYGTIFNNTIYILNKYVDLFFVEIRILDLISLFLLVGAMGKSAQLILHIWLPDAMEGPTPVSALIHAATMVTAGVFLIIRSSIIFEYTPNILFIMIFIGSLTCFLMSVIGTFQQDIKKIVAYSTCSQLGYMFISCGLSSYTISLFHLFNHAFFKALLFLSMGVIIHALMDEQDLRKMGSLINLIPFTSVAIFFGSYALLGLPFFAGFYSKDILLEIMYVRMNLDGLFTYTLGILAAFFTSFYSTRLFLRVFFNYLNITKKEIIKNLHEADSPMYISMTILLLFSFFVGYLFFDIFVGLGSQFFFNNIYIFVNNYNNINIEFEINNIIKLIPLFISISGFLFYYNFDLKKYIYYHIYYYRIIFKIWSNALFFDKLYIDKILISFLKLNKNYYINIETNIYQKINKLLIENIIKNTYNFLKININGYIHIYILYVITFLILIFFFKVITIYINMIYILILYLIYINYKNKKIIKNTIKFLKKKNNNKILKRSYFYKNNKNLNEKWFKYYFNNIINFIKEIKLKINNKNIIWGMMTTYLLKTKTLIRILEEQQKPSIVTGLHLPHNKKIFERIFDYKEKKKLLKRHEKELEEYNNILTLKEKIDISNTIKDLKYSIKNFENESQNLKILYELPTNVIKNVYVMTQHLNIIKYHDNQALVYYTLTTKKKSIRLEITEQIDENKNVQDIIIGHINNSYNIEDLNLSSYELIRNTDTGTIQYISEGVYLQWDIIQLFIEEGLLEIIDENNKNIKALQEIMKNFDTVDWLDGHFLEELTQSIEVKDYFQITKPYPITITNEHLINENTNLFLNEQIKDINKLD